MRLITSGVFLTVILSAVFTAPAPAADDGSLRLPKSSFPLTYDISLTTSVHTGLRAFTGVVRIEIEIKEPTNVITLHNRELQVQSVFMKGEDEVDIATTISEDKPKEFLMISTGSKTLQPTERYTIEIRYLGSLQSGTSGFYRSSYRVGTVTRYSDR